MRVGVEHKFEKRPGVVGLLSGAVVLVSAVEELEIDLGVD